MGGRIIPPYGLVVCPGDDPSSGIKHDGSDGYLSFTEGPSGFQEGISHEDGKIELH